VKVDDKKLKGSFRTSRNTNYLSSSSRNAKKEDMRRSFNSERRSQSFRGSRISSEEKKDREMPNLAKQIAAEISDDESEDNRSGS
jgi:hypothetical protein